MKSEKLILAGNPELQDRAEIFCDGERIVVALADGAGGISGGAQAADELIRLVAESRSSLRSGPDCVKLLQRADEEISAGGGETTGIVLIIEGGRIFGGSVGDSEAWFFTAMGKQHLTKSQQRKPLVGSGEAQPAAFAFEASEGLLLVASDGLWKYTSIEKIGAEIQAADRSTLLERLAGLVRLRSGALQDDVAMVMIAF